MSLPYVLGSEASKLDWKRIESDESRERTYCYADGTQLSFSNIEWVAVKRGEDGKHSHRLRTLDGVCMYVPPGWLSLVWPGKFQF